MPQTTASAVLPEPEITVIPDKFYGAALKAQIPTVVPPPEQPAPKPAAGPPKKSKVPLMLLIVGVVVLAGAGVFVYFNRNLLFPPASKPVAKPVVQAPTPVVVPLPSAPTDLLATSTNAQSATLSWTDTSNNETGFRLERAQDANPYAPLTFLPPNSSSFVDSAVQSGATYRYRVIAINQTGDSLASNEATTTVPLPPAPAPEQPKLPPAGLDSDSDGLTDLEETSIYGTNAQNPDSDGDGFLDGNEVYNLYNPEGKAPAKLQDSGAVKPITGSAGWSMFIPVQWTTSEAAADGSSLTIVSGHGETFKLAIVDNPNHQTVLDWYLGQHPDAKSEQILKYRSKHGYEGIIGPDMLTTYIPWGDKIFTFTYDMDGQSFINYRTTYYMMLNSLILNGLPVIMVPAGSSSLPFEPSATTTGEVNLPESVFPAAATSTGGEAQPETASTTMPTEPPPASTP